jgi:hypothetical protein
MRALNHACVLSHSRVKTQLQVSALLCSASLIVQSHARDKLPKTASRPVLSLFGLRPIRCPPSPSCAPSCSFVLLRARSLSSSSITTTPSSPITPIPRRQHQHLSSPPPSTVHQSTVAGRHSFLSALLFSSSTCAGLSASRYCRCWRHRHPPSAQRQFTRELLL